MNAFQLERQREKLLKRRKQILQTIRSLEKENQELAEQEHFDWLDRSWNLNESRLLNRLSDGYLREAEKIETALRRILVGTYGLCIACHEPIEKRRLELFPEAEFCHDCQDMRERFEKAS
jgi:DnaK suppressor protein